MVAGAEGYGAKSERIVVRLARHAFGSAALLLVCSALLGASGGQWPRDRHDARLTGRASVGAGSGAPHLAATIDLGGASGGVLLGDVDGDGEADAVYLRGGSVGVTSSSGRTIFERFEGATDLVAVVALDGDSRAEVLFMSRDARSIGALDPRAGSVRWRYVFPSYVTLDPAYVRVADISSTRPGLETIVFPDHTHTLEDASGYFFTATGELYARPVVKSVDGNQLNFPQLAVANVDGKGDPEVVVVGRPKLLVFASDGRLVAERDFRSGDPQGRHYGSLAVANLDDDAELEAVVVVDRIWTESEGEAAAMKPQAIVALDLAPEIREQWRVLFAPGETLETIPNGVADFDGDGATEVAVNRFDGKTQLVEIYAGAGDRARSGNGAGGASGGASGGARLLCAYPSAFAWDARDVDGDDRPELLASAATKARPALSFESTLLVLSASAAGGSCRLAPLGGPLAAERYVTRPLRAIGGRDLASSVTADRTGVVVAELFGERGLVTYTRGADGASRVRFRSFADGKWRVREGARAGAIRAVAPGLFVVADEVGDEESSSLAFYRWEAAKGVTRGATFRAGGFDGASPVAADVDGDGRVELVARRPGRRVTVYDYDPATRAFTEAWSADGATPPVVDASAPGGARIYTVASTPNNRALLVAYGSKGETVWKRRFGDLPVSARPEVVLGQFTGAGPLDAWVSSARDRSWLVDGASGDVVWESPSVFTYDNRAAVTDVDRDGADDLVVVANGTYGVYSGRDAKAIHGPVDVRSLGGELFATPILAEDGTMLLVARGTIAKAKIAGKKGWRFARKTERNGEDLLVGVTLGKDGAFDRVAGNFGDDDRMTAFDYKNGRILWTTALVPVTDVVTADLDGDGVEEFVFGALDGRVVAVRSSDGSEAWSVAPGAFVSSPIVADFGSGPSLVVPAHDGTIRVYLFSQSASKS
jgi:outer membrane protein assembly factor BamB